MASRPPKGALPAPAAAFEISEADVKPVALTQSADAFSLRDQPVMLAADVALILGVETREVVQNIKSNPDIFPERYAFELTQGEVESLRSAGLISKPGRGGSRALPWAVTRKGAMRLATIMKSRRAIQATDIFIDVFDEVLRQVQSGHGQVTISNPSRLIDTGSDRSLIDKVRVQLSDAVGRLLNTVVEPGSQTTVADELHSVAAEAVNHVKAWLKGKSVANDKIEAETLLIIEQAQDMYQRRQADLAEKALDRERKALENLRLRIEAAEQVIALYRQLEPSALVDLTHGFAAALPAPHPALPAPATKQDKT
jgi:hypothetical protein